MVKLFRLLGAGCLLLGVTLAAETNEHQSPGHGRSSFRNKRGLLSSLFGSGTDPTTEVPTEMLPVYGDPARPPLHMLYGHSTGLSGPYPPYPVMFLPGAPPAGEHGSYLPMLGYGGAGSAPFQPIGDSQYLPPVVGWPEQSVFPASEPSTSAPVFQSPPTPATTKGPLKPTTPQPVDPAVAKSEYLMKLNLSPAEEAELKRLAKQLGVTDFEHLPPFEDVKALLGTNTAGETIKAIKEYASTPDGLELIKDYVMSYQPAKRISLGQDPYGANAVEPTSSAVSSQSGAAAPESSGFFAQLRRLKSLLTFGYFDANETTPSKNEVTPPEVPRETPFKPNEFPAFEVRDVHGTPGPVAHYLVPVRPLPHHALSSEMKYASALPFPYAVHYPAVGMNPFAVPKEPEPYRHVPDGHLRFHGVGTVPQEATVVVSPETPAPKRAAPLASSTGEVHTFERTDIEPPVRSTAPAVEPSTSTVGITVENVTPDLVDVAELLVKDTTDFILNVLDTDETT